MDKALKVLYYNKWYKRSSDLGGHLEAFLPDTMQSDSHPLGT